MLEISRVSSRGQSQRRRWLCGEGAAEAKGGGATKYPTPARVPTAPLGPCPVQQRCDLRNEQAERNRQLGLGLGAVYAERQCNGPDGSGSGMKPTCSWGIGHACCCTLSPPANHRPYQSSMPAHPGPPMHHQSADGIRDAHRTASSCILVCRNCTAVIALCHSSLRVTETDSDCLRSQY
jgi:hypothetical protein